MKELQAIHYGEVELIPGVKCDGYVLSDGSACLDDGTIHKYHYINQAPLNDTNFDLSRNKCERKSQKF